MHLNTFSTSWRLAAAVGLLLAQQVLQGPSAATAAVAEPRDHNAQEVAGGGSRNGMGDGEDSTAREEILQNREKRKRQLRNVINQMRKQLADHSAGEITLQPKEKVDMERRLDLHVQKLDMLNRELEEKDIDRIVTRTQAQKERRARTVASILATEL